MYDDGFLNMSHYFHGVIAAVSACSAIVDEVDGDIDIQPKYTQPIYAGQDVAKNIGAW